MVLLIRLINLVLEMSVLAATLRDPPSFYTSRRLLEDVNGFLRTVCQGELIGAEEQLEEFQRLINPSPELQTAIRHAETLLKIQLFFTGIQKTPNCSSEDEETEFLSFLTTRVDPALPEIEKAAERTLSYLQMKKLSAQISLFVGDLVSFSQKIVDLQSAGIDLSPEEMKAVQEELASLKSRVQKFQWKGKEKSLAQIGKLEMALPAMATASPCISGINGIFHWISSKLFAAKTTLKGVVAATPIGILNEGNSCFIASAIQLILLDPILEEALIEEWVQGGPAKEFGEFLFNYREAEKNGQKTVRGIGKLRRALSRLSGNNEFDAGQWDANEVLRTLIADERSALFQKLQQKGYLITETVRRYYEPPTGEIPREGGDLHYDPLLKVYYSEREALRPAQVELEVRDSDANKPLGNLIDAIWRFSLEESEPGNYEMQDLQKKPCKPLFQKTGWSNQTPDSLTISLKRWAYAGAGVKVDVPILVSEIEKIQIGESKVPMRLIGFTSHSGSTSGGHWISYSARNGSYTCNNDSRISTISREEFLLHAQKASDLLYEKIR